MKQKIFALLLIILVLTGCSDKKAQQIQAAEPTQASTEPASELGALITAPANNPTGTPAAPSVTETAPPPTTVPPPAPTAPPAIIITKNPSSETVTPGARTWFIASAENATQITWEFFSPDGTMYSLQQAMSAHPGLILEVLPEDTLGLRQIPASFSGWSARARYDGPGGTATTERATITVQDPYEEVIETYRTVHRTGTGNIEKGISELVNSYDFVGYTKQDLDGNGVLELILASDVYNSNYPYVVYEIYTIQNGNAVCVAQSRARERYFMLVDGTFLMEGSSGAMYSSWVTYKFSVASLTLQEQVWTSDKPHDMADFAPYYYYCGSIYGDEMALTYDVAAATIDNWKRTVMLPALTPIN